MNLVEGPVWKNGAFHSNEWTRLAAGADIPATNQPLLVPFVAFQAETERFLSYGGPLGVELAAGDSPRALEPYLWKLSLIALVFPKFHDGRSYSAARLLRERFHYQGELRARGDVLADQIPLMRRCGILTYEVHHAPTRAALKADSLAEVRHFYQPIPNQPEAPAGTRPWLRQPVG